MPRPQFFLPKAQTGHNISLEQITSKYGRFCTYVILAALSGHQKYEKGIFYVYLTFGWPNGATEMT